ncbi:MAG: ribbon-helix-helix domain-containing protein [Candidatus Woesearchaeota archaeon]
MENVLLKLDKGMLEQIDSIVKGRNYGTRTEFIRASIREKMEDIEKEEHIKQVLALKGIIKGRKITDEELRQVRLEVSKEYMKEWGLE